MAAGSLIWTRARDDWDRDLATAKELGIGHQLLLHIPCISFSPTPVAGKIPAANYIIFNSSNAVRFAMANEQVAAVIRAAVKIFAIGPGTAQALTDFDLSATPGFAGQSAKDLADQLLQSGVGGSFLIPTARESAFDTASYLTAHGRQATAVNCYETFRTATKHDGSPLTPEDIKTTIPKLTGVICFASPSAVQGFDAAFNIRENALNKNLAAVAIGPTTLKEALPHFENCHRAGQNSVRSLLETAAKMVSRLKKDPT